MQKSGEHGEAESQSHLKQPQVNEDIFDVRDEDARMLSMGQGAA